MSASLPLATAPEVSLAISLARLLGAAWLILAAATWKLWISQTDFPQIPLIWPNWPVILDQMGLLLALLGGGMLVVMPRQRRIAASLLWLGLTLLFMGDQHRLQPWAWQFWLLAMLMSLGDDRTVLWAARWLVISLYAYSALSKFDLAFVEQLGNRIVSPATAAGSPVWNRGSQNLWRSFVGGLPWLLPCGELAVALLLARPAWRRCGFYGSVGMHLGLLGLLGPWGLNHSWGVLLWNVYFILQNSLLFRGPVSLPTPDIPRVETAATVFRRRLATSILVLACIMPAGSPWGLCDPWPGWAVYAVPFERMTLWIDDATAAQLPEPLRRACRPAGLVNRQQWTWGNVQLDINAWSLETLGVPEYPGVRGRTGVAIALWEAQAVPQLDVVRFSRNHRGETRMSPGTPLSTHEELQSQASRYWFNAIPRPWSLPDNVSRE